MNRFIKKDKNLRIKIKKKEKDRLVLKYLTNNKKLSEYTRGIAFKSLDNLSLFQTRVENRCFLTGRSRSIYASYGVSRLSFRRLVSAGSLLGIKKSSW